MVFIFSDSTVDWSADTTGAQKLPTRRSSSGQEAPHTTAAQGRACREEENTERSLSVLRTSTPLKPKPNRKRTLLVAGTQQALRVRITCHHHLMPAQCAIVCTNAMVSFVSVLKLGTWCLVMILGQRGQREGRGVVIQWVGWATPCYHAHRK